MARNLAFVISVGLDYYLPSTLHGHDTSYSPDGDHVNPRNDNENNDTPFTYKDASPVIAGILEQGLQVRDLSKKCNFLIIRELL